ncbi:hypothetical protein ACIQOF_01470 [Streptomyces sp. NPDC091265]|uniref:hypothetical protein n=1 Tax=unclassified Streptomyces TaxID=2593676 RepID=UPI00344D12C0
MAVSDDPAASPSVGTADAHRSLVGAGDVLMPQMQDVIAANQGWLTDFHFPSRASDLNSKEGIRPW